jgi:membrane protease YdiL (CAAX protease family)
MISTRPTHARPQEVRADVVLATYVAMVVTAEAVTVFVNITSGLLVHAGIIVALLIRHFVRESTIPLSVLALPPLLRVLSFTMPIPELPVSAWYVLVGLPVLVACGLAMRATGWWLPDVGLRLRVHRSELVAVAMGLPLGWAASQVYSAPEIRLDGAGGPWPFVGVMLVFVALPEELLFRGMVQRVFSDQLDGAGVVLGAILFAAMYVPSLSPGLVVIMGIAGLAFGWAVAKSGNLGGAIAGHALLLASVWDLPTVLGI